MSFDRSGLIAVLANTSFNSRGEPIVNHAATALRLLREAADLHAANIEEHRFDRANLAPEP